MVFGHVSVLMCVCYSHHATPRSGFSCSPTRVLQGLPHKPHRGRTFVVWFSKNQTPCPAVSSVPRAAAECRHFFSFVHLSRVPSHAPIDSARSQVAILDARAEYGSRLQLVLIVILETLLVADSYNTTDSPEGREGNRYQDRHKSANDKRQQRHLPR